MTSIPLTRNFVYDTSVSYETIHGKLITDEQIQAWADEAERGYEMSQLPPGRPGRPPVGKGAGIVVPVRLDQDTIDALMEKGRLIGLSSRSEAVRTAVSEWLKSA